MAEIRSRFALVNGTPIREDVTFIEVPADDDRGRPLDGAGHWLWISAGNSLIDVATISADYRDRDDNVVIPATEHRWWGDPGDGYAAAPLAPGVKIVDRSTYENALVDAATQATAVDKSAAAKRSLAAIEAYDAKAARYRKLGWDDADIEAEFGPNPKAGI